MDQSTPHLYYHHLIIRRTLQFLVPVSIFSLLISYFSGFSVLFLLNNLQFSSLIFPTFDQALDRKYMFLICNGILAFLARNLLKLNSSGLNCTSGLITDYNAEDGLKQNSEMPIILKEVEVIHENATSMDYVDMDIYVPMIVEEVTEEKQIFVDGLQQEEEDDYDDDDGSEKVDDEIKTESLILESEEWEEDDDDDEELGQDVDCTSLSDVRVSTEELNKKFEEFIRKMKQELSIEARQQLIHVV